MSHFYQVLAICPCSWLCPLWAFILPPTRRNPVRNLTTVDQRRHAAVLWRISWWFLDRPRLRRRLFSRGVARLRRWRRCWWRRTDNRRRHLHSGWPRQRHSFGLITLVQCRRTALYRLQDPAYVTFAGTFREKMSECQRATSMMTAGRSLLRRRGRSTSFAISFVPIPPCKRNCVSLTTPSSSSR
jgi:hypothetical protein